MTDRARRHELQRRAFAPGGALTAAEAAELRALTTDLASGAADGATSAAQGASASPGSVTPPAATDPGHSRTPSTPDMAVLAQAGSAPAAPSASASPSAPAAPDRSSPRMGVLLLCALVAMVLGVGGSWLLGHRAESAPAMTYEQAQVLADIEKTSAFDPGSAQYLGEKDGASVWRATTDDGEEVCLAMHLAGVSHHACTKPPHADDPFANPVSVAAERVDGDTRWTYWAALVADVHGRDVLLLERHAYADDFDWRLQYTEEERVWVEKLVARGIAPESLSIIGYDGNLPIFLEDGDPVCGYVVDPVADAVVDSCIESREDVLSLAVTGTTYELRDTPMRGFILTIVRTGE